MRAPVLTRAGRFALNLLLIFAAAAAVGWLLMQLRLVVLPVLLALAAVLWPPVEELRRRGWRPGLAAGTVMLTAVVLLGAIVASVVPIVNEELDDVAVSARSGLQEVVRGLAQAPLGLTRDEIDRALDNAFRRLRDEGGIARNVVTGAVLLGELIAGILLAMVVLFFLLKDGREMRDFLVSRVPEGHRERAVRSGLAAWTTLGGYLRGIALVAVVDSVLIGLALWILGVPLVIPLMVLTFFGAFIPLVGAVVAGAVAALVTLVSKGALLALVVVAVIVAVQQLEGDLLYPLVVGRAIDLHPVVVLLALTAGSATAGVIGALIAVPSASAAWNAWTAWHSSP